MARVLIIGGHGKVAMRLAPLLIDRGDEVTSVIRNPDHAYEVGQTGASPVVADVETLDEAALTEVFRGHDAVVWSAGAAADYPIFSGGAARAGVELSVAQRDAALAAYEGAIQTAFREVADALARAGTIGDELDANRRLVAAAEDTAMLTDARYRGGIDTFLASLDAQRSLTLAPLTCSPLLLVVATKGATRPLLPSSSPPPSGRSSGRAAQPRAR